MKYTIADNRLKADAQLTAADFHAIAKQVGHFDTRRKIGFVSAMVAGEPTQVVTYRGGKETENIAQPGDYIATNLLPDLEPQINQAGQLDQYVIRANRFFELYQTYQGKRNGYGEIFKAKSVVKAIYFSNGAAIAPPWGGRQICREECYLFLNGSEVYLCDSESCDKTYEIVAE